MTRPCFQVLQSPWITGLFYYLQAYPVLTALVGTTLPSLAGRFLEGASGTVRQSKSAGLPNITGSVTHVAFGESTTYGTSSTSSAFSVSDVSAANIWSNGTAYRNRTLSINASKSNSIYGNSTTVQPASYTVNYLIKAY